LSKRGDDEPEFIIKMFNRSNKRKSEHEEPAGKGAVVLSIDSGTRGLEFLIELVRRIRPDSPGDFQQAELKFSALLYSLHQDRSLLFSLRRSLLTQFQNTDIINALTESGITSSRGFVQELSGKIQHKILPALQQKNDFLFVLNRVFYKKTDYRWVEGINQDLWKSFFEILGIQINLTETQLIRQLQRSLQILSYRLANLGLEKEILRRYGMNSEANFPFLEQNRLVNLYHERARIDMNGDEKKLLVNNIGEALHNCRQSLQLMKENRALEGTSLAQTFLMVRMEQHIERMFIILDVLDEDQQFNTERFILYFNKVIRNENRKNSINEFLSNNLGLLAYQIAEHKGRKGESYITTSRRQFISLFRSAMRGGFIISFIAIFKNLLGKLPMAPFWQGFLYGTNYSFGFVLMDQVGATLATKQPAYTASAVASSLDARKSMGRPDLNNLAITVARVVRSQSASFAGNLVVVFPLTYGLAWLWHITMGYKIAEGDAAMQLLESQHPWHSLALLYACFTGFFLFLSGIIAGYVENHVIYGKIPERLSTHPVLSYTMSPKRLNRLVNFVRRGAGGLAGSIALGFFLGIAGPLGKVMGLPFDIRHITISAGNAAIGYYGLDHNVPLLYSLIIFAGVIMIGFLNFLVSFALAFYVAVRSRGIQLRDYPELIGLVWKYFRRYPMDFMLPPRHPRVPEALS
jgi:site-specific recombinase